MLLYVHKNQVHSECMLLFKCCMLRADGAAGWLIGRLFSLIRLPHEYVHCARLEIIIAIKSSTTGVRAAHDGNRRRSFILFKRQKY